jgi:hypothetical protein
MWLSEETMVLEVVWACAGANPAIVSYSASAVQNMLTPPRVA